MGVNLRKKSEIIEEMEYFKMAVDRLQQIIDTKSNLGSAKLPINLNHDGKALQAQNHKSTIPFISTLKCDACWVGGEII